MEENKLKKALTAAGIWSVAVGAVISGSYYGWNYIASETNFTGCLIAMAIATLFYIPFAFMFAELATAIPSSAGPAAYTEKAFGRGAGFFAGFSYLVESLFCTPGICIAVGAYVHTLFPVVPAVVASVVAYLIFLFINMRGIEAGQLIGLIVTIIGVAGVVFYACIGLPHADFSLLGKMGDLGGVKGIFVAIPYAVWFYLAFEAGGMGAEECKNPSKDIPKGFIVGIFTLLIGGMLPFVFSAMTMDSVSKAAYSMIEEVRRQFRTIPGIMEGTGKPDYKSCVAISTTSALKEMLVPGVMAVLAPLVVGLLLGTGALGGMLAGALVTGVLMAIFMSNAGGAWDNAKKFIEDGNHGGKGSEAHRAAVVGDTVGDPFKDTSGPSINILIKLMTIVSLVFVPLMK